MTDLARDVAGWDAPCARFELDRRPAEPPHADEPCRRCRWGRAAHAGGRTARVAQCAGVELRHLHPYLRTAERRPPEELARTIAIWCGSSNDGIQRRVGFIARMLADRLGKEQAADFIAHACQEALATFVGCSCAAGVAASGGDCAHCGGRGWIERPDANQLRQADLPYRYPEGLEGGDA